MTRGFFAAVLGPLAAACTSLGSGSAVPPPGASACSGCHAASAQASAAVPRLAGAERSSIVKALQEFRNGRRPATVMDRIAKGFSEEEIEAIAAWYAARK